MQPNTKIQSYKPVMKVSQSNLVATKPTWTYEQVGITYEQSGLTYEGVYEGYNSLNPIIRIKSFVANTRIE